MHTIRGNGVDAVVDADHGGRIVSLTAGGREWLSPSTPRMSGPFVHEGTGGWDEAIPTVAACRVDGVTLPDHGDAWRTGWTVTSHSAGHLAAAVDLRSLPLRLSRRIEADEHGIRLSYSATSESTTPVRFLWSAHPLFSAPPGSRLLVDGAGSAAAVEEYPGPGIRRSLPPGGAIDSIEAGGAVKLFVEGVDAASVVHADGVGITVSWNSSVLPYLGLYWDRGVFSRAAVMAIEPTMAPTDSAELAPALWQVDDRQVKRWQLAIRPRSRRSPRTDAHDERPHPCGKGDDDGERFVR